MVVSQGAGTFLARVRIGTSNELSLLRLEPGTPSPGAHDKAEAGMVKEGGEGL